jgi:serine/threonine protein kinase
MEMGDEELAAWLVSLRAERPSLASDLEGLLADRVAIAREGFLEDTAVPLMRPSHPSSLPSKGDAVDGADRSRTPASLGSYRLIRRLGEGGMGIVYLAEQSGPITREVALKVIRPGLDSQKVLARFSSERQILANLSHPGISRVYDAGATPDGRPYVAMEYVPGTSLTRFCDEARMPVRERLELFLQVCAAIQHAHQKGVIHRDIKPSNLLVTIADGRPFVKVIDFGIAKALTPHPGDEMLTQTGATLGTPEYMSPEQASGDPGAVDTRSDVYALGVVLYELLAGARPFEMADLPRATPLALLEAMRDKDPPRLTTRLSGLGTPGEIAARRGTDPRRLARQLEGELEWITLRALEKAPSRRYTSAAELGADIERHLKGEPVLAGPPSTLYRLNKLVCRHRVAATALGVVAITVTAGSRRSSCCAPCGRSGCHRSSSTTRSTARP